MVQGLISSAEVLIAIFIICVDCIMHAFWLNFLNFTEGLSKTPAASWILQMFSCENYVKVLFLFAVFRVCFVRLIVAW